MKIGIDIRAIGKQRTGDESYTLNLVQGLAKIDNKNQYCLYTNTGNEKKLLEIEERLNLRNDKFKIIPVLPSSKMFWTSWSLPRHIKKDPIDLLHVQYIVPQGLPQKTRLVTTIHDVSFVKYPQHISKKDLFLLNKYIPKSLKKANWIIAISKFTKEEIVDAYNISEKKISVIHNGGASEEYFQQLPESQLQAELEMLDVKKPYIFYLGTLQPRKNISFLIEGFAKLKEQHGDTAKIDSIQLIIAGAREGHNYDKKIDRTLKKLDKRILSQIKFLGYVDDEDRPTLFQGAKIFCFPSMYEGFGLPPIESMASGTPVVCSNSSCFSEIVGDAAALYIEDDLESLVSKLYEVITSKELHSRLKEKGLEKSKLFSWEKCSRETLNLYQDLNVK